MKNATFFRNFIVFAIVLGISLGGLSYHIMQVSKTLRLSDNRVSHTQNVIRETQEFMNIVTNTLAMQRNIILLRQADRQPYEELKEKLSTQIALLRGLTKDNVVQTSRLTEVEHLALKFKDTLDEKITKFESADEGPALADYEDINKIRTDMFRLTNNVLEEEYSLLDERESVVHETITHYQASLLIGAITACIIILIFNWFLLKTQSKVSVAEASFRESEERLRLAIRGSNDGIFDWNFKTHEIYWSSQYKNMLGYSDDEIRGDEETFRSLVHPEDSETFWEAFNNYINGHMSEFSTIFRMLHKEGRDVWVNARGKALFDENGRPQRFIGAHTDITYLKEHERELQEERDRAEAASAAKGEFLAHMSHEIRTPLTAVSGIAEIFIQNTEKFDEQQKKLIRTLKTSTESLKELITDILDFSKIESGEVEMYPQKFVLGELFQQVISIMSVRANEKLIDLNFEYNDVKNTVFNGDKQRIRQVLLNLVGNAIKFTEKGYVSVRVVIEPVADSHVLRIDIEDSGIGISQTALPVIFEKFRQADSSVSRRYGGTGLGLPISKSLAELMGGTIKVKSEVGKGTVFTLVLPFTDSISELEIDISEVMHVQKLNDRLRAAIGEKKKILLVEDYEGNIVVLSYILNSLDCDYDVARTGLEAVQQWKEHHYDLILMDVQMPEMDGLTATRTIRKMEDEKSLPRTPIIGLTAHALVADKQKCIDSGMDDYLSKPIVEADLKAKILNVFESAEPGSVKNRAAKI